MDTTPYPRQGTCNCVHSALCNAPLPAFSTAASLNVNAPVASQPSQQDGMATKVRLNLFVPANGATCWHKHLPGITRRQFRSETLLEQYFSSNTVHRTGKHALVVHTQNFG